MKLFCGFMKRSRRPVNKVGGYLIPQETRVCYSSENKLHFRAECPWLHTKVERAFFPWCISELSEGLLCTLYGWVALGGCDATGWVISLTSIRRFVLLQRQEGDQSSSWKQVQGMIWNPQLTARVSDLAADGPPFILNTGRSVVYQNFDTNGHGL